MDTYKIESHALLWFCVSCLLLIIIIYYVSQKQVKINISRWCMYDVIFSFFKIIII